MTTTTATAINTLSLTISGSAKVDVMSIVGFQQTTLMPADITSITNNTSGEILGITGASIGAVVSGGSIGVATPTTPMAIMPTQTFGNAQAGTTTLNQTDRAAEGPVEMHSRSDQGYAVVTSGNVLSLTANQGVGNVFDSGGAIGSIVADANGKVNPGVFSGIDGPILAADSTAPATSRILSVSIGQGMLFTGTGGVGFSGLYAFGDIGTVTNNGKAQERTFAEISFPNRQSTISVSTTDRSSTPQSSVIMAPLPPRPIALTDFARQINYSNRLVLSSIAGLLRR